MMSALKYKKISKPSVLFLCIFVVVSIVPLFSACQTVITADTPTVVPPTPTLTLAEQQPVIWSAWESGPHGAGYDLGKGPNTYCARCHSPANWNPSAKIDPPPNCVSCKFPHDDVPRIAEGNPLIPEAEWKGIECTICHPLENGALLPNIAWYDTITGYHETVVRSTELCEKCHQDTPALRHKVVLDGNTHAGYDCTSCHDPHTALASCDSSDCHSDIVALIAIYSPFHVGISDNTICLECHPKGMRLHSMEVNQKGVDDCLGCHMNLTLSPENPGIATDGHAIYHKNVNCVACHDAAGLVVKPIEGQDQWMTFRTTIIESLGRPIETIYTSHNLQRQVECERCHFSGNSWGISETVLKTQP